MKRVVYVSGSRADYGPARRVLLAIRDCPDLSLAIAVTGMHLDPIHGETWREIESDGFDIALRVPGRVPGDSLEAMAASVGRYCEGFAHAFASTEPDIVLVLGDRGESLAATMAAAYLNVAVVHLCGGTLSGSIDDATRHAITKYAHWHLPPFEEAARRIVQMGEDPSTVHVVGLPGGDLRPDVVMRREEVCAAFALPADLPYVLVVQHAVTHSAADADFQAVETLEALAALPYPVLLANPNDDAGGRAILAHMHAYAARDPKFRILTPPVGRERFASVMAHAGALVGNSSSGIVEAMSVGLPVVNVGERQRGREHLACLVNVQHERTAIARAVEHALHDPGYRAALAAHAAAMARIDTPAEVVKHLRALDPAIGRLPKRFFDAPGAR